MKAIGIVRRIDDLGRVVIPREIRKNMGIKEGDDLEIYTTHEGEIVFKPLPPESNYKGAEKFVFENIHKIACILPRDRNVTEVVFKNGVTEIVTRHPDDEFNLNVAVAFALNKAYPNYQLINLPEWLRAEE